MLKITEPITIEKVRQFLLDFGPGFHPDTLIEDYRPKFSKKDEVRLRENLKLIDEMYSLDEVCQIYIELDEQDLFKY